MKKNFYFVIGIAITTLFSCEENQSHEISQAVDETSFVEENDNSRDFESKIVEGELKQLLYSNDRKDSSELKMKYAYFEVDDNRRAGDVYQDSVNQLVADFVYAVTYLGEERSKPSFSLDLINNSLSVFSSFYKEMIADEETINHVPWDLQSEVSIDDSFSDYVQVTTSSWSYTGGAHGNGFIVYFLLSKSDGHDMKLDEFFNDIPKLNILAASKLREKYKLSPEQSFSDASLWIEDETNFLNDNFYFDNGDLVFYFNQYEIASYADGPIEIRLSEEELKPFLK